MCMCVDGLCGGQCEFAQLSVSVPASGSVSVPVLFRLPVYLLDITICYMLLYALRADQY